MSVQKFTIRQTSTIREALIKIEDNHEGFILVTGEQDNVIGIATNGDIRRRLLADIPLDAQISLCMNKEFVSADAKTSREVLLKQLDHQIHCIPILDENKLLIDIVTKDGLPGHEEEPIYTRARAPVRISFSGGGSDITHFFCENKAAVINTTISIYSHATLRKRADDRIIIHSQDLGETLETNSHEELYNHDGKFQLITSLIKTIHPQFGFELFINSDYPMQSGLGGSAVVSAAILGCFNQFRQDKWDRYELAELAFQAERLHLGISGGWQDQYATIFGGFNLMEFGMKENVVNPLRVPAEIQSELEASLILCNTNISHESGKIHNDQKQMTNREDIQDKLNESVELTYKMRNHLLRGQLHEFGKCLHQGWQIKRKFSSLISNTHLDEIYDSVLNAGALGGKILGAGGGGYFLFFVPPFKKLAIISVLQEQGLNPQAFQFESDGLQSWSRREHIFSEEVRVL